MIYKAQRELLKLHLILERLWSSHLFSLLHSFDEWIGSGVPPEDIDRALTALEVLKEALNERKAEIEKAIELTERIRRELGGAFEFLNSD